MDISQLTPELSIGGQPQPDDITALRDQGFRTVVNLRMPDEPGVLPDEERLVQNAGLNYAEVPISPDIVDDGTIERLTQILTTVDTAPVYVHCKAGGRAGTFSMLHLAIQHGWSIEQAYEEGEKVGIVIPEDSPYRAIFEGFLRRHSPGER